jgi:hypothetical protein
MILVLSSRKKVKRRYRRPKEKSWTKRRSKPKDKRKMTLEQKSPRNVRRNVPSTPTSA